MRDVVREKYREVHDTYQADETGGSAAELYMVKYKFSSSAVYNQ